MVTARVVTTMRPRMFTAVEMLCTFGAHSQVTRVRVGVGGGSLSVATVQTAGIAHENRLLLYHMAALSMSSARVNGMLVVEASTHRVAFDDPVAHCGSEFLSIGWLGGVEAQEEATTMAKPGCRVRRERVLYGEVELKSTVERQAHE